MREREALIRTFFVVINIVIPRIVYAVYSTNNQLTMVIVLLGPLRVQQREPEIETDIRT